MATEPRSLATTAHKKSETYLIYPVEFGDYTNISNSNILQIAWSPNST